MFCHTNFSLQNQVAIYSKLYIQDVFCVSVINYVFYRFN